MGKPIILAPSLLAADFSNLTTAFDLINQTEADWLHLDVMDGQFVPNISFGMPIIEAAKKHVNKPLDVHLMIEKPDRYIKDFRAAGADIITVHYEACTHLHRTIYQIKESGAKVGVALNPHTPVQVLENVLEDLDLILLMSVNPGFGGQKFIYQTLPKVRQLKGLLDVRNIDAFIEIDGGVGLQNAEALLKVGANVLVAGSSVFKAGDPKVAIKRFKQISDNLETKFV